MAKVRIRKARSVPYAARILGTIALTAVFGYLLDHLDEQSFIVSGILISPVLPMLWMSVKVLEINDDDKYWWTYHWILGYKWGEKNDYPAIKDLVINEVKIQPKRGPEQVKYQLTAYFTNHTECPLTRKKNLKFLMDKSEKIAEKLGVELISNVENN